MLASLIFPLASFMDQTIAFQPVQDKMIQIEHTRVAPRSTPTPGELTPRFLFEPPTGSFLIDLPEFNLVQTATNYVQAIAVALPIDEEEDQLVRRIVKERMATRRSRSLRG